MGPGILLSANVLETDSMWLPLLALLGVLTGIFLFFRGFRMLQYKRLILNTPFSKIRSASMGLVEVSGMPTGPKTISAAITGAPCYYYRARAWQWLDSGKGGSWQQAVDESVSVPFFLEDNTGRGLVNPQGATLDVHRSFYDDIRTSFFGKDSAVPVGIQRFVASRGLTAGDKVRLEEHIIMPDYPLFVFGTLGENSTPASWNAQPHASGNEVSVGLSFGGSPGLKFSYGTSVSGVAAKQSQSEKMTVSSRTSEGGTLVANRLQTTIASTQEPAAAQTQNGPQPDISPDAFDLHPRVAINQGERGDPFTISSQSQREVVQSLGWKSMGCIWGGPVFALICLYFLFVFWGWM